MIGAPSRDRALGLLAQAADIARAGAERLSAGDLPGALARAEQCERTATAVREEIEDLVRIRRA